MRGKLCKLDDNPTCRCKAGNIGRGACQESQFDPESGDSAVVALEGASVSEVAPSVGGGAPAGRPSVASIVTGGPSGQADIASRAPAEFGTPRAPDTSAGLIIRRIVTAAAELDPAGLQAQLDVGLAHLGLAGCVDQILLPAVAHLHQWQATQRHQSEDDLLAAEAVRAWLNNRGTFAPPPRDAGPILLACGPRDRQTIGLEALALLLRFRRWPCRSLGARTSTFTLTVAAQAADAAGIVVFSMDGRGRLSASASVRAVAALGFPVFFAGSSFDVGPGRDNLPGQYLGTRMADACALITTSLQDRPR